MITSLIDGLNDAGRMFVEGVEVTIVVCFGWRCFGYFSFELTEIVGFCLQFISFIHEPVAVGSTP